MTSSVFAFGYFTHFSNINICGTNADICKQLTPFYCSMRILYDKVEKSRGKYLIIVPL